VLSPVFAIRTQQLQLPHFVFFMAEAKRMPRVILAENRAFYAFGDYKRESEKGRFSWREMAGEPALCNSHRRLTQALQPQVGDLVAFRPNGQFTGRTFAKFAAVSGRDRMA
jgi:hypothetical protein